MSTSEIINVVLVAVLVGITAYYAVQTRRQANLLSKQVQMMADQRRRTISPALQVENIAYAQTIEEIDTRHNKSWVPHLDLSLKNMGSGVALNIEMTASATVWMSRGGIVSGNACRLQWELKEASKDIFLAPQTSEPIKFSLKLARCERISEDSMKPEMNISLKYTDIDENTRQDNRIWKLSCQSC